MARETTAAPAILNPDPTPEPELKSFHKKKMLVWSGKVNVGRVSGWVWNRRIDLFVREFQEQFGREPSSDEIYEKMVSEDGEYQLRSLAKSIAHNGVRLPIILAADGRLLDGNRRYFATRYAIEKHLAEVDELEDIPAWVLTDEASEEDERKVLIETNFLPSYKLDWANYIKALVMFEDYYDRGVTYDKLAEVYGMTKSRIRSMVQAMDLINEFVAHFHDDDNPSKAEEAQNIAYKHFVFFEEAYNKLRGRLDSDVDLKEHFFDWMLHEKFSTITEVRRLGEVRDDQEAWDAIRQDSPDAVKRALHVVDDKRLPDMADGERKIKKVIRMLQELKEGEIASMTPDTLDELRDVLEDVHAMAKAVQTIRPEAAE
jgi:hypothetical protein